MNMLVMLGRKRTRFTEIFHWKMLAPFKRSERFGDSQENINMEKRKKHLDHEIQWNKEIVYGQNFKLVEIRVLFCFEVHTKLGMKSVEFKQSSLLECLTLLLFQIPFPRG